ncbi:SGNH/GDSL hydrolase family protein [Bacillus sp. REN16]|uniref:SGNH/GDSL hydrolase family protein n=1 Tax=Bacillus sp. REN16 TaxID=2887296 RepID=UPI001E5AC0A3|nr:SGNH/GDSL hydrolase family protein [Bacillus sp. REN16]MCC3355514.1 SGNH/GDSL hydrolase family protein [Bacillus sp. REN16]
MLFKTNDRILFIGDSITDAGRLVDPEGIGQGYVRLIRDYFYKDLSDLNLKVINKGVSGNRVTDLASRWNEDVIKLNPNWVSVSIGINDVWRQIDQPTMEQVYPKKFEEIYTRLLTELSEETQSQIILMEPTVIVEDRQSEGNQKLIPYVEIVRKLAKVFNAILIPTHRVFIEHLAGMSSEILTKDGVHMNNAGNKLLADTWLAAVK